MPSPNPRASVYLQALHLAIAANKTQSERYDEQIDLNNARIAAMDSAKDAVDVAMDRNNKNVDALVLAEGEVKRDAALPDTDTETEHDGKRLAAGTEYETKRAVGNAKEAKTPTVAETEGVVAETVAETKGKVVNAKETVTPPVGESKEEAVTPRVDEAEQTVTLMADVSKETVAPPVDESEAVTLTVPGRAGIGGLSVHGAMDNVPDVHDAGCPSMAYMVSVHDAMSNIDAAVLLGACTSGTYLVRHWMHAPPSGSSTIATQCSVAATPASTSSTGDGTLGCDAPSQGLSPTRKTDKQTSIQTNKQTDVQTCGEENTVINNKKAMDGSAASYSVIKSGVPANSFILSVVYKNRPTHHLVAPDESGVWCVGKKSYGLQASSMKELIAALTGPTQPQDWPVQLTTQVHADGTRSSGVLGQSSSAVTTEAAKEVSEEDRALMIKAVQLTEAVRATRRQEALELQRCKVATEETGALQHAVDLAGQELEAAQDNISEAFQCLRRQGIDIIPADVVRQQNSRKLAEMKAKLATIVEKNAQLVSLEAELAAGRARLAREQNEDDHGGTTRLVSADAHRNPGTTHNTSTSNISNINISNGTVTVKASAFQDRGDVMTVYFPPSVTRIGKDAFRNCRRLRAVHFSDDSRLTHIDLGAFAHCSNVASLQLPPRLQCIGREAFHGCGALNDLRLPDSVLRIEDLAFRDCTGITNLHIGTASCLTALGNHVFAGCDGFAAVRLPDGVVALGHHAFDGCTKLQHVSLPDSLDVMGDAVFKDCTGILALVLPATMTYAGVPGPHLGPIYVGPADVQRAVGVIGARIKARSSSCRIKARAQRVTLQNRAGVNAVGVNGAGVNGAGANGTRANARRADNRGKGAQPLAIAHITTITGQAVCIVMGEDPAEWTRWFNDPTFSLRVSTHRWGSADASTNSSSTAAQEASKQRMDGIKQRINALLRDGMRCENVHAARHASLECAVLLQWVLSKVDHIDPTMAPPPPDPRTHPQHPVKAVEPVKAEHPVKAVNPAQPDKPALVDEQLARVGAVLQEGIENCKSGEAVEADEADHVGDSGDCGDNGGGCFSGCINLRRILVPDSLADGSMASNCSFTVAARDRLMYVTASEVPALRREYWHPTMHWWCHERARVCVRTVFAALVRAKARTSPNICTATTTAATTGTPLPSLDLDLWMHILSFIARHELGRSPFAHAVFGLH